MRFLPTLLVLLFSANLLQAQNNPEVYLADISFSDEGFTISNVKNISNSPGYDNQPSFLPDGSGVLFSAERGESTDIKLYNISTEESRWLTNSEGGKYSPTITPDGIHFTSVWLKPNGEQLLWKFPLSGGEPQIVIQNEVIGYHAWFNENTLYTFVLGDNFTFVEFKLGKRISRKVIATSPGRSIHKVPEIEEISFIDKNDSTIWFVKSYNPNTKQIRTITSTPQNSEDMYWIDSDSFLIGQGNTFLEWKEGHGLRKPVTIFDEEGIISRISLSPDGTKIAIVFTKSE
ncbi:MAG: hypothetical protein RLN90_02765 [Balneolaceae bacterium]